MAGFQPSITILNRHANLCQSVLLQNIEDVLNNLIIFIHLSKKTELPINIPQNIEKNTTLSQSVQSVVNKHQKKEIVNRLE